MAPGGAGGTEQSHRVPGLPHRNLAGQNVQVLPGLAVVPELKTEESVSAEMFSGGSSPGFFWLQQLFLTHWSFIDGNDDTFDL